MSRMVLIWYHKSKIVSKYMMKPSAPGRIDGIIPQASKPAGKRSEVQICGLGWTNRA